MQNGSNFVTMKLKKIVAVDPTGLLESGRHQLREWAGEVVFYDDLPQSEEEVIRRIGDAEGVLVSYHTRISRAVLAACPRIRYIGMCCTLYGESSANVDIRAAGEKGIKVAGIKDYGDEGVVEYVISELVRLLHGFGSKQWKLEVYELTGQKVGIIGLGRTGKMIADALRFFGAEVYYYSRSRKPEAESEGIRYLPLHDLLKQADIVGTCLPRNTILLGEPEFRLLGSRKIVFNTSVGITFEVSALKRWLEGKDNYYLCDGVGIGGCEKELQELENVLYTPRVAGHSVQCMKRLTEKVVANISLFLDGKL